MTDPVLLDRGDLDAIVQRLGAELSASYDDGVLLVAMLKGSVVFLADLVRAMTIQAEVDFLAVTSYAADSGRVRIAKDIGVDIAGRDVVLIEAVVDTGLSLSYLLGELRGRRPRSLEVCALLDKTTRRVVPVELRWVGAAVDAPFVIGYGLDHAERYRNLDLIAEADQWRLVADPDALVAHLYPPGAGARTER